MPAALRRAMSRSVRREWRHPAGYSRVSAPPAEKTMLIAGTRRSTISKSCTGDPVQLENRRDSELDELPAAGRHANRNQA